MTTRVPVSSAAAWLPADLGAGTSWAVELTDDDRAELVAMATALATSGADPASLRREQVELPGLATRVATWSTELATGRGFVLVRGFPVELLDEREIELAYVGLGVHLGTPVGQNAAGDLLTQIRDERLGERGPHVRLYRTNERQDFHTDAADIVGLLCLHGARSGGESRIASSASVYNELLRRRPDLLEVLYEPMCWDRNGEEAVGELPYFVLAPIRELDGVPRLFYIGWYIRSAQRHPGVPPLRPEQLEAMELLEAIANDPAFHLEMDFRPGDVQFLNNGRILHAREAYEDDDDSAARRHLLRLWLVAHRFASVDEGLRVGIGRRDDHADQSSNATLATVDSDT